MAEAQAMALIELVARAAARADGPRRRILLAADDYSAVSRRVPLSNLYERGRSLGLGVQVSAQSWEGLGSDDDERKRITSTADGGIWLLRTPAPESLILLAGTRRILESGRKLLGAGRTGDEGTSRVAHTWIVDPDRIRQLHTGQAVYIRHGTATFVQITPASPNPPPSQEGQPRHDHAHPHPRPPAPHRRGDHRRRSRADRRSPHRRAPATIRGDLPRLRAARGGTAPGRARQPGHLGSPGPVGRPLRHRGHHPARNGPGTIYARAIYARAGFTRDGITYEVSSVITTAADKSQPVPQEPAA